MRNCKEAFKHGFESQLGDWTPILTGAKRVAWETGAYFMRAGLPMPGRVSSGPRIGWRGGNGFAPCKVYSVLVDHETYASVPCNVGTRTIKISGEG